jgi:hypothetical protein
LAESLNAVVWLLEYSLHWCVNLHSSISYKLRLRYPFKTNGWRCCLLAEKHSLVLIFICYNVQTLVWY